MTVDFAYSIMKLIINKNQQGNLTPVAFNNSIKQGQLSFVSFLLGQFQQYQIGRAQARVSYGMNEVLRQKLTPSIYGYNLSVDSTGFAPYPGDYELVDSMWSFYGYQRVRYVEQDALYSFYNSVIDPVASNPIYLIEDKGFRFYPNNILATKMSYVRTPPDIIWGYTLDSNGLPVYDPSTSQDPIFYDTDVLEIISRALMIIGTNLQSAAIAQYAEQIKSQGQ